MSQERPHNFAKLPFVFVFKKVQRRIFPSHFLLSRNSKEKCLMDRKHALKKFLCKSFKINAPTNATLPETDLPLSVCDIVSHRVELGLLTFHCTVSDSWWSREQHA